MSDIPTHGPRVDIVTVFHCEQNYLDHLDLAGQIAAHADGEFMWHPVDNRIDNRGFGPACNFGALIGDAPIVGFLNPDCTVTGPFIHAVEAALAEPGVVITGCRFGKPQRELHHWGVTDWVCGAAMFVDRDWWETVGGFDEQFVWGWEETDLIRRAQNAGLRCKSIDLPIHHESPTVDSELDRNYKHYHFERGALRFRKKWRRT